MQGIIAFYSQKHSKYDSPHNSLDSIGRIFYVCCYLKQNDDVVCSYFDVEGIICCHRISSNACVVVVFSFIEMLQALSLFTIQMAYGLLV